MKKSILLVATAILISGCGMMQNTASNTTTQTPYAASPAVQASSTAVSAGQSAGSALQALYTQYKADGKYDYTNMQNILNTVTLISNCDGLKQNYKDQSYLTDFGKGMILGSIGLVTQNNVQTVTNSLVDMMVNSETVQQGKTQLQNSASAAAGYANTAAQYAGALSSLLSAFSAQ